MKKYGIVPPTHPDTQPMEFQEVLQWTDNQIFAQTGEHLDSLQAAILQGTWQRQTYPEIAKQYNCSEIHVKKEAAKLWHLLSDVLEEDINKRNFRARAERFQVSHISGDCVQIGQIGQINICGENIQNSDTTSTPPLTKNSETNTSQNKIDLRDAPEIFGFYNRTSELATLNQWILESHSGIITIFGLSGMGKTALAVQLIQQIKDKFEYIIWRSLKGAPTLAELQTNLMQFLNKNQTATGLDAHPDTLMDYFRAYPCLVILDDVQMIFSKGELAGEYQPGWEDYGNFFKQIAELSHQSCILLLSWEKPREIAAGENRHWKSLQLKGLDEMGQQICQERGLAAPEKWPELMTVYQGHPLWINIAATLIKDLFGGYVDDFLSYQPLILGDIEIILRRHWQRLSEVEKQVMLWLANQEEAVDIVHISGDLPCSRADFWPVIQSLARRCLIEKVQWGERSFFSLPPVVKAYVQQKYSQVHNS